MEKIAVDKPVSVAGITLISVSKVLYWSARRGASFFGAKHPVAVVVVSLSGNKAFKLTGEEVPLEELMREFPGIGKAMEAVSGDGTT
jgi:uncharacterized spore protein YtfJ